MRLQFSPYFIVILFNYEVSYMELIRLYRAIIISSTKQIEKLSRQVPILKCISSTFTKFY